MLIRLIGSVAVVTNDQTHRFSAPKLACVLAALAVKPGEPVEVTTLLSRVWGDQPPESAVGVLYSYVTRLRRFLRDRDVARIDRAGRGGYVLEIDPDNIDVHKVRKLMTEASRLSGVEETGRALAIWREASGLAYGEALVGIDGRWAADYRSRFRGERLQLLAGRYDAELKLGHHHDVAEAVAREPLAEPLVEHLMVALYRCGRSAEALNRFESTRVALRDRLGADPGPRLRALHRRILNHDVNTVTAAKPVRRPTPPPTPVPAQLPADTAGFLGRKAETAAIHAAAGRRRIVVIDGMAGVGKTALALHVAHKLAPEYPDGQLFVDLRGYADKVTPLAPEQALSHVLRSLGAEVPGSEIERSAALRTALAGRRMLLVLDNAGAASQVLPLLPGTGESLTIVTSRRRLVGLTDSLPVSLDTLTPGEAAKVFNSEAGIDGAEDVVDRIAAVCGHLPLALRIAASRLRSRPGWTAEHLLRRLTGTDHAALRELDGAGHGVVTAFDLSYRELDDDTRRAFRLLSVYPGATFDRHIAATLADVTPDDADRALERLVDAHLVQPIGHDRYRLHDLLRNYAATVTEPAERSEAKHRLTEHYIWMAWQAIEFIRPETTDWQLLSDPHPPSEPAPASFEEAVAWLNKELDVLIHLADGTAREDDEHLVDLSLPLQAHMSQQGSTGEARLRLANAAMQAAERLGNVSAQARLHKYLGSHHDDLGEHDRALSHLEQSLKLWESLEDEVGIARASYEVTAVRSRRGDSPHLIRQFLDAAEMARRAGAAAVETHIRITTSGRLGRLGRLDEAEKQLEIAERLVVATNDQRQSIRLKFYRAAICGRRKRLREAYDLYREVVDYSRENQIPDLLISGLYGTTEALLQAAEYEAALTEAQEQLDTLQRWHFSRSEATAFTQLGRAQAGLGAIDDATDSLRGAMALAEQINASQCLAEAEHALGELLASSGDRDEAVRLLTSATEFFEAGGYEQASAARLRLTEVTSSGLPVSSDPKGTDVRQLTDEPTDA